MTVEVSIVQRDIERFSDDPNRHRDASRAAPITSTHNLLDFLVQGDDDGGNIGWVRGWGLIEDLVFRRQSAEGQNLIPDQAPADSQTTEASAPDSYAC